MAGTTVVGDSVFLLLPHLVLDRQLLGGAGGQRHITAPGYMIKPGQPDALPFCLHDRRVKGA